jgi:hypothetical protein
MGADDLLCSCNARSRLPSLDACSEGQSGDSPAGEINSSGRAGQQEERLNACGGIHSSHPLREWDWSNSDYRYGLVCAFTSTLATINQRGLCTCLHFLIGML